MICVGWSFQNSSVSLKLSLYSIETVLAHISVSSRHKAVVAIYKLLPHSLLGRSGVLESPVREQTANKTIKIATRMVFLKGGL